MTAILVNTYFIDIIFRGPTHLSDFGRLVCIRSEVGIAFASSASFSSQEHGILVQQLAQDLTGLRVPKRRPDWHFDNPMLGVFAVAFARFSGHSVIGPDDRAQAGERVHLTARLKDDVTSVAPIATVRA